MDIKENEYEPVFYLTKAETEKESNYLQVIYKIDKANAERLRKKKEYLSRKGDWSNESLAIHFNKEEIITLSELATEGLKLLQEKKNRELKFQSEAEEYKAKLRKIYKFRKFKDDPKTEKMIAELRDTIDPKDLEKYEKFLPAPAAKGKQKKLKLRIEAKQNELDKSFNDENDSVDSNRSLKSAAPVEMDIEDSEFKYYTSGLHQILNEMTIPTLIADEQLKESLARSNAKRETSKKKKKKEEKKPDPVDLVKEVL